VIDTVEKVLGVKTVGEWVKADPSRKVADALDALDKAYKLNQPAKPNLDDIPF
jgi:hypothetical protein